MDMYAEINGIEVTQLRFVLFDDGTAFNHYVRITNPSGTMDHGQRFWGYDPIQAFEVAMERALLIARHTVLVITEVEVVV